MKQAINRPICGYAEYRVGAMAVAGVARKRLKDSRCAFSWRKEPERSVPPASIEDFIPHSLKGLEYRRETDGAITIISEKLEITVRRK